MQIGKFLSSSTFVIVKKNSYKLILYVISLIIFTLPNILFMPITAKVGDLMPIVVNQTESLLQGENIYQYYLLDNGVETQAVRQPGVSIAYVPAEILGTDYRILSLVYVILCLAILVKLLPKKIYHSQFLLSLLAISTLILSPYRLVRTDLYDAPYWFLLSLALYLLYRKRYLYFAIIFGLSITVQVWSWVLTPFVLLYLHRNLKFKEFLSTSVTILTIGVGILLLFILRDPGAYYEHVFEFYRSYLGRDSYVLVSIYLTPLLVILGLTQLVLPIQGISLGLIGGYSIKKLNDMSHILFLGSLALFTFIQFNSLSWNYMYFVIILMMIFT